MAAFTISRVSAPMATFAPAIYESPGSRPETKVFTQSISRAFFTGGLDDSAVESIQAGVRRIQERTRLEAGWKDRVLNCKLTVDSAELTRTAKSVMAALTKFGDEAIDLSALPADRVNGMHLAVLLRATWTRKESTKGWKTALGIARAALANQGVDPSEALIGMVTPE